MKVHTMLFAAAIGITTLGLSDAPAQLQPGTTGEQRQPREAAFKRATLSLMPTPVRFANSNAPLFNITPTGVASGANLPVLGGGTIGRMTKWTGLTGSNSFIGDTTIFEDKNGLVGIGTDSPTSRLTVAGTIQSLSGGIKFPDGSVQTSSAAGALFAVIHDETLAGAGTALSPLQVASPLEVRDRDNPARQPFQREASCSTTDPSCIAIVVVPAGKRLVIEYVSMLASIPAGELAQLIVNTSASGDVVSHPLALSSPAIRFGLTTRTIIGQQVRMYSDPGFLNLVGERSGSGGSATFSFSISGYLVDLP